MSLHDVVEFLRTREADAKAVFEQHLPFLADLEAKVAGNPVMAAMAEAQHLAGAPEVLGSLAGEIRSLDAALAAAKDQAVSDYQARQEAERAAAEAAAQAAAEPDPASEPAAQ